MTALFAIWFCGGLLYYLPNNGGSGLSLPFNISTWIVIALATLWLTLTLPVHALRTAIRKPKNDAAKWNILWLLPAGALLWSLPLIWSPSVASRIDSLPHVAALWGFLGFLWLLRRLPYRAQRSRHWLVVLWAAALLQAIFGFLQVTVFIHYGHFPGSRPYGIFQQPNLQASFIGTGLACLLYSRLFLRPAALIVRPFSCCAIFFLPFMLVWLQSRAGTIGGLLAVLLLSSVYLNEKRGTRVLCYQWLLMLSGVALALLLQDGLWNLLTRDLFPNWDWHNPLIKNLFSMRDTTGSTHAREYILKTTWQVIKHHPWVGTGYGSYEAAFANETVISGGNFNESTLIHPHNELLYAWAEGGFCALAGMVVMIGGILLSLWNKRGLKWCGVALLLPIAIHMNLEYPLYQSVPHGLAMVMLLSLVLPPGRSQIIDSEELQRKARNISNRVPLFQKVDAIRTFCFLTGLVVLLFMTGALQTQQTLVSVERENMAPLALDEAGTLSKLWNPISLSSRVDYDWHVALLMRYNITHEKWLLRKFDAWAEEYLKRHNDPNLVNSRLMISTVLAPQKSAAICHQAHLLWPSDKRFRC